MKAMILAAGLGTRLRPLTFLRPKVLIPVANIPLIDRITGYLEAYGISDIIINAHHLASQIVEYIRQKNYPGLRITVKTENQILGTGGGIKNVEDFFDEEPFVVINGDILTDINLQLAIQAHLHSNAAATLVVQDYPEFNQISVDEAGNITGFSPSPFQGGLAFTGIHIINRKILDFIPGPIFYSIIDAYRNAIGEGLKIKAYVTSGYYWRDLGTLNSYLDANRDSLKENRPLVSPLAVLDPSVKLERWVIIGDNAKLERGVRIRESVVWENSLITENTEIIRAVVTPQGQVKVP